MLNGVSKGEPDWHGGPWQRDALSYQGDSSNVISNTYPAVWGDSLYKQMNPFLSELVLGETPHLSKSLRPFHNSVRRMNGQEQKYLHGSLDLKWSNQGFGVAGVSTHMDSSTRKDDWGRHGGYQQKCMQKSCYVTSVIAASAQPHQLYEWSLQTL